MPIGACRFFSRREGVPRGQVGRPIRSRAGDSREELAKVQFPHLLMVGDERLLCGASGE